MERVLFWAAPDRGTRAHTVSQVCAGFWPPYVQNHQLSLTNLPLVEVKVHPKINVHHHPILIWCLMFALSFIPTL